MSSVDVMYQPYAAYFPYQKAAILPSDNVKKFGVPKMHGCMDLPHYSSHSSNSSGFAAKTEYATEKETPPTHTQYISANCVLLTYFSGDISTHVDEHFSRALSQPGNYNSQNPSSKTWKELSSMSHRNLPPSFWNSNYHQQRRHHHLHHPHRHHPSATATTAHPQTDYFTDPYMGSLHPHPAHDPWHYPYSTQTHSYAGHSLHPDLSYPSMVPPTSRLNPHYGLFAANRLGGMTGQYELNKDPWGSKYTTHADPLVTHTVTHLDSRTGLGGIETPTADTKEMGAYWF